MAVKIPASPGLAAVSWPFVETVASLVSAVSFAARDANVTVVARMSAFSDGKAACLNTKEALGPVLLSQQIAIFAAVASLRNYTFSNSSKRSATRRPKIE